MAGKISQAKAPEQTFEEVKYLRHLIEHKIPVRVRLTDNEEVDGVIEFYDSGFVRLTHDTVCHGASRSPGLAAVAPRLMAGGR